MENFYDTLRKEVTILFRKRQYIDGCYHLLIKTPLRAFTQIVSFFYFLIYPLSHDLGRSLFGQEYRMSRKDRVKLNDIRFRNIRAILFSQAGAISAFLITIFFGVISFSLTSDEGNQWQKKLPGATSCIPILVFIIKFTPAFLIFILLFPYILRRIVDHLSADDYAKTTVGSLNQQDLLVFLAYKNWLLIEDFLESVLYDVIDHKTFETFKNQQKLNWKEVDHLLFQEKDRNKKIEKLRKQIESFLNRNFKEIQQCISLVNYSFDSLRINKRELTLHVMQFSPGIFYENLISAHRYLSTAEYFIKNERKESDVEKKEATLEYYTRDFCHLLAYTICRRKKALEQLILFRDINKYIVGLASVRSTSLALKIFLRGLSELNAPDNKIDRKEQEMQTLALLHRSKAHCGADLLIHLENFLSKYENELKPYELANLADKLYQFKYEDTQEKPDIKEQLADIRFYYRTVIQESQDKYLFPSFLKTLGDLIKENPGRQIYMLMFGYSELLKQCLKKAAQLLTKNEVVVFVMQDEDSQSLDTRMFRFEANKKFEPRKTLQQNSPPENDEETPNNEKVEYNFSAKDSFIESLITPSDKVVFLAGAEFYDEVQKKLFHTNKYQRRIEAVIKSIRSRKSSPDYQQPEMWVVAEKYKIMDNFPLEADNFGRQFYRDYYETFDLYCLEDFEGDNLKLISDRPDKI